MVSGIMKYMFENVDIKKLVLAQEPAFYADISINLKTNSIYYLEVNRYAGYARDGGLIARWILNEMEFERETAFEAKENQNNTKQTLNTKYATEIEKKCWNGNKNF